MDNDEAWKWIITIIGLVAGVLWGMVWGGYVTEHKYKDIAIKNGHAEYVIADNTTGLTEFRWKDVK